jgi:hypothetical protein
MMVGGIGSRLGNFSIATSKPLIHDAPKYSDSLPLFIEEVFEEPWLIEFRGIRISLAIFAEISNPITWFLRIDHSEKISRIKKRSAGIIQNAQFIGFDAEYNVRLTKREVTVTSILLLQFDDHDSREDSAVQFSASNLYALGGLTKSFFDPPLNHRSIL